MTENRKIEGTSFGAPVKVNNSGHPLITGMLVMITFMICAMSAQMDESNKLKQDELEIRRQELNVARQQYALDSLRYFGPKKIK